MKEGTVEKSKLFRLLRSMTESETTSFRDFVSSPYFNKNKNLEEFLKLIIHQGFLSKPAISKEEVLKKLFPDASGSKKRLPDLMHGLMQLLEEFLVEEKYRKNHFQRKISLMSVAYERELDPMVNSIEKDIDMLHKQNPVRDSNYFYESFMIHSQRDYSFRLLGKISDNNNLSEKIEQLDLFYLALKLKDSCELLNRSMIVSSQFDLALVEHLILYLQAHHSQYEEHPAIQIYLASYLIFTGVDHENNFLKLVDLLRQNGSCFSEDELRSLYTYAQNHCIRQINQGNIAFTRHLFNLYNEIFSTGLVFGDNKSIQWDFKNFVSLGLRLKEFDWTLNIINTFKDKLPAAIRQNAYTYNLANYYYETGDYKKATRLLNSVEFTDIYYCLDSKAMLLKIFYKVEEEESFYALISSFGNYLRRNKLIAGNSAEVYHNLIRFTKKAFLLKIKLPYQRKKDYQKKIEGLKNDILETRNVANINWLLQEVDALTV
jgi:hypothetical protein